MKAKTMVPGYKLASSIMKPAIKLVIKKLAAPYLEESQIWPLELQAIKKCSNIKKEGKS